MTIITGIVSKIANEETAKGKPKLSFAIQVEGEEKNAVVFTEARIATFADVKDGDEITINARASNGQYADKGTLIVSELNPELPEPSPFYTGEAINEGTMVVLTAGAFSRKSVVGLAAAMRDISAEDINDAQAEAEKLGVSWQEVLVDSGALNKMEFVELQATRAYKEGDTKPAAFLYAEDRPAAGEFTRKVTVAGYAEAKAAEAAAAEEAAAAAEGADA